MSLSVGTINPGFSGDISRYYGPALSRVHAENVSAFLSGQPIDKENQTIGQELLGEAQGGLLWGAQMASPYVGLNALKNFKNMNAASQATKLLNGGKVSAETINAYNALLRSEKFLNKYNCTAQSNGFFKALYPEITPEAKALIESYRANIKAGKDLVGNSAALEKALQSVAPRTWIGRAWSSLIGTTNPVDVKLATQEASKAATEAKAALAAKATAPKLGVLAKGKEMLNTGGFKGMFLIEAAMALFTDIIPTFSKLGAEKGLVQTAKSTVEVGASAGGFALGSAAGAVVGAKAGAMAGAAIGSVVPVLGNAVGAVVGGAIGIACGLLGSWAARKAVKVVTGKTELEKSAETEKESQARKLASSPELQIQAAQQALALAMKNPDSKDAQIAARSAKAILENYANAAAEQSNNPAFGSLTSGASQSAAPTNQNAALWAQALKGYGVA